MSDRYSLDLRVLSGRNPVKRSPEDGALRAIMDTVKSELNEVIDTANIVNNARRLTTCETDELEKFGELLNLPRGNTESMEDYRARLLTEFRNIPEGITEQSLYDAVFAITDPDEPEIIEWKDYAWLWPGAYTPERGYFGKIAVGASSATLPTNSKVGCRFQCGDDASVQRIYVYLEPDVPGTRTAHCAIYADNAGAPAAKVADAGNTATVVTPGWYLFEFDAANLSAGGYYWLAVCVTGGSWKIYYDAGSVNQAAWNSDTPPPDDPFGAVGAYNAYDMSIYAEYIVRHPDYEWTRFFNDSQSRFHVSVVVDSPLNSNQLDDIEENVIAVKGAHILVWIAQSRPDNHELLREIL